MNPKQECEELLNSVLAVARLMLKEHGEFYPYGGYMELDGEITHLGAKDESTDHPLSQDLIELLQNTFREMATNKQAKAVALICDVRVSSPGSDQKRDAIQACLDHVDGYSVKVYFPYQILDGEVLYGETYAHRGDDEIFGKPIVQ